MVQTSATMNYNTEKSHLEWKKREINLLDPILFSSTHLKAECGMARVPSLSISWEEIFSYSVKPIE